MELDFENENCAYYYVSNSYNTREVRYDKRTGKWNCVCKGFSINPERECFHILAVKREREKNGTV